MIQIRPIRTDADVEIARELFKEYASALGIDLEYQGFASELAGLPGAYAPPTGGLLLAVDGDEAAGCVAYRALAEGCCEMKRLYVRPAYRRAGLGLELVQAAIAAAWQAGYVEMRLDTLASMVKAQQLYVALGFREIEPYATSYLPGTRFYALSLVA